jgi:acyl-CoA dehydrogenase
LLLRGKSDYFTSNWVATLADEIRLAAEVCQRFKEDYWRKIDAAGDFPKEFVEALYSIGIPSMLVPAEYGRLGLGIQAASVALEEINKSGG